MNEDLLVIKAAVLGAEFRKLTLSKPCAEDIPWLRVVVRPVIIRGRRQLQFSYFERKKNIVKNFEGAEAAMQIDGLLAMKFGQMNAQTASEEIQVLVNRKGDTRLTRRRFEKPVPSDLAHDRRKKRQLELSDPFFREIGIVTKAGNIRTEMSGKFHQIQEFIRVIEQVVPDEPRETPLEILDCGCGSAYLTFAAFHYLNHLRGTSADVTGIDVNAELIAKVTALRDQIGCVGMNFAVSAIADYAPAAPPDIVLSLHACDTATDEAIAQAVKWRSGVILAAPCCQHELNDVLASDDLAAILRHGILRERLSDIVTDAFRAAALRVMGYRTSVIEFVSPDRTAKNLLIRAERVAEPAREKAVAEYQALKRFWDVTPAIERLLGISHFVL